MSHSPCIRCGSIRTLIWWPIKVEDFSGEICDCCMCALRRFMEEYS